MNLRERCQTVFKAGYQLGKTSFRSLAQKNNLSKSSVHRLYRRIKRRNQHPESELWESSAGQQWLRLLVLATIFVFALQGGIGCERLSQFFRLLRLQRHIGVSPTALRSLRTQMESAIIDYQQQQHKIIENISSQVEVCAAAERLFGQKFPDLFEYLVENLGELPQPRKSRKSYKSQTFTLPTVPS